MGAPQSVPIAIMCCCGPECSEPAVYPGQRQTGRHSYCWIHALQLARYRYQMFNPRPEILKAWVGFNRAN